MMLFRKAVCLAVAAAVFFNISFLTARASWENVPPLKLLTVKASDIYGEGGLLRTLGERCFINNNNRVFMLDDEALAKWRTTEKLEFTEISCDTDLSGLEYESGGVESGYFLLRKDIPDTYDRIFYVFRLDMEAKTLSLAYSYTCPSGNFSTRSDGYSCAIDRNGSGKVIIFDTSGHTTEALCPKNSGSVMSWSVCDGEYIAVFEWKSFIIQENGKVFYDHAVYTVKTNGSVEELFSVEKATSFSTFDTSSNCVMWKYKVPSEVLDQYVMYSLEDNRLYRFEEIMTFRHMGEPDFFMTEPERFGSAVSDKRIVMWKRVSHYEEDRPSSYDIDFDHHSYEADNYESVYFLAKLNDESTPAEIITKWKQIIIYGEDHPTSYRIDFNNYCYEADNYESVYFLVKLNDENTPAEIITNRYKYIGEGNGGIYPMKTYDGRWGYIDKDGNELAMFDKTGDFCGKYAPVFENGGVYLIDRNMNIVSDQICVDNFSGFWNYGDVFEIYNGYETILATYADNFVDTKGNSTDNPTVGAADVLAPIMLTGGAAVVVSKKRKK